MAAKFLEVNMLASILSWFRKPATVAPIKTLEDSENLQAPDTCLRNPSQVSGRLTHKKIYTFGVTQSGQHSTKCRICLEPNHHVFSIALDEAGQQHRCCLRCLKRLGGNDQVRLAAKRSRYARRVVDCMDALDQLRSEFPDPSRRPYGEKALVAEIDLPFLGYQGIERVLAKIHDRKWTAYDIARVEGRPEPEH